MPDLRLIHGGHVGSEVDDLIAKAREGMADYVKLQAFEAERKRVQYNALIAVGFSPDEALKLLR